MMETEEISETLVFNSTLTRLIACLFARESFKSYIAEKLDEGDEFLRKFMFSGKSIFHFSEMVSRMYISGQQNSLVLQWRQPQTYVWCELLRDNLIGPSFLCRSDCWKNISIDSYYKLRYFSIVVVTFQCEKSHFVIVGYQYNDYAMGWTSRESGFDSQQGHSFLSSPALPDRLWGSLPPIQYVPGALFPGSKWSRCEADHSSTSRPEVKNTCTP
jgi:hypothetical protein